MGLRARTARARLRWQAVRDAAGYRVYRSARNGAAIDWDAGPINPRPIPQPATMAGRHGFGHGAFGRGGFGHAYAGGPGFGHGPFGRGPFGRGAVMLAHTTPGLEDGDYLFAVVALDAAGNEARDGAATAAVQIRGTPARPTAIKAAAWAAGELSVEWPPDPANITE